MKVTQMPASGKISYQRRPPAVRDDAYPVHSSGIDIKRILSRFEKDDYILIGLIAVLVFEGCDDYILLAALGYLFIMGFKEL